MIEVNSLHGNRIISEHINAHLGIVAQLGTLLSEELIPSAKVVSNSLASNSTLFWCGNGGSAADSQHLAAEFVGRFNKDRRALRSIALTTDSSILTCISNDYSYESIFSRQLEALGNPGDVLIAISTSGNSPNVVHALEAARKLNIHTIALLGNDGGLAKNLASSSIVVPSSSTARIQESHILIGHILCDLIEKELGIG